MADIEQTNTHLHRPHRLPIASASKRRIQFRLRIRRSPHASRNVLQRSLRHLAVSVHVPRISAHGLVGAGWHRQNGQHIWQRFKTTRYAASNATQWKWEREEYRVKPRRRRGSFRIDRAMSQWYVFGGYSRQGAKDFACER